MCRVLRVSRSGYYKWVSRTPSKRDRDREIIETAVKAIYAEHRGMVGSPKMYILLAKSGVEAGKNRVARIMRSLGLRAKTRKRYSGFTTDSKHNFQIAENHLNREFNVDAPNKVLVSDITYIDTAAGWVYLTVFIDLFSRLVVGWSVSRSLGTGMVLTALDSAVKKRGLKPGVMIHSDRGSQYASNDFREMLNEYKFVQSMSRKGNCWDNAVAESFFKSYKCEMAYHCKFKDETDVWRKTFEYIEGYYNRKRIHGTIGYLTPEQSEMYFYKKVA